jgi:hypothetical protein
MVMAAVLLPSDTVMVMSLVRSAEALTSLHGCPMLLKEMIVAGVRDIPSGKVTVEVDSPGKGTRFVLLALEKSWYELF